MNALILGVMLSASTSHDIEIRQFASTMEIAQVASDRCVDILVNLPMLADYQRRLHIADTDAPAIGDAGRAAIFALSIAFDQAPTRQAWCDATYRLYGPDGQMIPGLMQRAPAR